MNAVSPIILGSSPIDRAEMERIALKRAALEQASRADRWRALTEDRLDKVRPALIPHRQGEREKRRRRRQLVAGKLSGVGAGPA